MAGQNYQGLSRFRKSVSRFSDRNLRQNKSLSRRNVGEATQVCLGPVGHHAFSTCRRSIPEVACRLPHHDRGRWDARSAAHAVMPQHIDPRLRSRSTGRIGEGPETPGANCVTHANSAGEKGEMPIRMVALMFSRVDQRFLAVCIPYGPADSRQAASFGLHALRATLVEIERVKSWRYWARIGKARCLLPQDDRMGFPDGNTTS